MRWLIGLFASLVASAACATTFGAACQFTDYTSAVACIQAVGANATILSAALSVPFNDTTAGLTFYTNADVASGASAVTFASLSGASSGDSWTSPALTGPVTATISGNTATFSSPVTGNVWQNTDALTVAGQLHTAAIPTILRLYNGS